MRLLSPSPWAPWTWGPWSRAGDLGRVIIYVSVPVQLIPYRIRAVTGCSEGCVGYVGYAIRDDRDGVVVHYIDSCVPLGN